LNKGGEKEKGDKGGSSEKKMNVPRKTKNRARPKDWTNCSNRRSESIQREKP